MCDVGGVSGVSGVCFVVGIGVCVETLWDGYIKSVPLLHVHVGTKQVPIARAATAIQAI